MIKSSVMISVSSQSLGIAKTKGREIILARSHHLDKASALYFKDAAALT